MSAVLTRITIAEILVFSCLFEYQVFSLISQLFASFVALNSCVGLMKKNTGQTFILAPATPVTRKTIDLSSTQCAVKYFWML